MVSNKTNYLAVFICVAFVSASHAAEFDDLRILTFNVWSGEGSQLGRDKIAEIIRASGADIVGLQEMGNVQGMQVAEALGFHYLQQSNSDTQFVSRFPILDRTRRRWGGEFEITPGHTVWLFNAHLAAYPYQPYDLRDGTLAGDETAVIRAAQRARGGQVASMLRDMESSGALTSDDPVFVTGDFNEPSHLDWTQSAADFTDRPYDLKVDYPTSTSITELGLVDSIRNVRPLEPTPGTFDFAYTWTPGYPPPRVPQNEVHDRIDIVYHRDGATTTVTPTEALTLGPAPQRDADSTMTDIQVSGYNADHRAVVVSYDLRGMRGSALTFSKLGSNDDVIDQGYGDRLVTTPSIDIDYEANGGLWKFWEENNWDRGGVAFLDSGSGDPATGRAQFDVTFSPIGHHQIQLDRFDILDWMDDDNAGHTVHWQLLQQDQILHEGVAEAPSSGSSTIETGMMVPGSGSLTLRLTHVSGFDNKLAIDNIVFDQIMLGDFDRDGSLDEGDIDDLSMQVRRANMDGNYDLNSDGEVSGQDRVFWIETLANTFSGDSNLDGEFNTTDLVAVFQSGQYEDELDGNSGWSDGDWSGDGDFASGDLVLAFESGGFERGPRAPVAIPEPSSATVLFVGGLCLLSIRRINKRERPPAERCFTECGVGWPRPGRHQLRMPQ